MYTHIRTYHILYMTYRCGCIYILVDIYVYLYIYVDTYLIDILLGPFPPDVQLIEVKLPRPPAERPPTHTCSPHAHVFPSGVWLYAGLQYHHSGPVYFGIQIGLLCVVPFPPLV